MTHLVEGSIPSSALACLSAAPSAVFVEPRPLIIQLKTLTARRVLLDCGFDFSEDIATLKKLHEAGIITKEELDRLLSEYA